MHSETNALYTDETYEDCDIECHCSGNPIDSQVEPGTDNIIINWDEIEKHQTAIKTNNAVHIANLEYKFSDDLNANDASCLGGIYFPNVPLHDHAKTIKSTAHQ